ncbi:MAG: hypothetical protein ACTSSP_07395 [Candidatus Asgardarchaeia archaeon]
MENKNEKFPVFENVRNFGSSLHFYGSMLVVPFVIVLFAILILAAPVSTIQSLYMEGKKTLIEFAEVFLNFLKMVSIVYIIAAIFPLYGAIKLNLANTNLTKDYKILKYGVILIIVGHLIEILNSTYFMIYFQFFVSVEQVASAIESYYEMPMGGPLESLISPPIYDYISWCSNAVLGLGIIFISRFIDLITSEYKLPDYSTWNTILLIGGILMMVPPLSDFGGFIVFLLCIMIGGRLKKVTIS